MELTVTQIKKRAKFLTKTKFKKNFKFKAK